LTSDTVHVTNNGEGVSEALSQTEAVAAYRALSKKNSAHLRILAEEMMGMLKSLTGEREADFWIESNGSAFCLHLKTNAPMNRDMRRRLLSVTSDGENAAEKGVIGKLRDLYEKLMEPEDETMPRIYVNGWSCSENLPMDHAAALAQTVSLSEHSVWSLKRCVGSRPDKNWDGLEKSVIANIADDVEIGIANNTVDMTVYKTF